VTADPRFSTPSLLTPFQPVSEASFLGPRRQVGTALPYRAGFERRYKGTEWHGLVLVDGLGFVVVFRVGQLVRTRDGPRSFVGFEPQIQFLLPRSQLVVP